MSFRTFAGLATLVATGALIAWGASLAGARAQANIYSVHPLVADAAGSAPAADASLVNGWGLSAGPTTPWWTANNGSNTSTLYSGVGAKSALTVTVRRRTDGHRLQRQRGRVQRQPERQDRLGAVPLRHRRRHDHGLVADGQRHRRTRRRRPLVGGCDLQGPRDRQRQALCHRLPQRTRRRVRPILQSRSGRIHRPEDPGGLRAVRHSGAGREHLRHLREAGCGEEGRRRRSPAGIRRRVLARRAP